MHEREHLEDLAMQIIAGSGAARGAVFEALAAAKQGAFERADELITQADELFVNAHKAHTELVRLELSGKVAALTLILTHAQDHLMSSDLARELVKEIIYLHRQNREAV